MDGITSQLSLSCFLSAKVVGLRGFVYSLKFCPGTAGKVDKWETLSLSVTLSGTNQGTSHVQNEVYLGIGTFAASRGYGYSCLGKISFFDGDALSTTFGDVSAQPFNVEGGQIQPAPGCKYTVSVRCCLTHHS